MRRQHKFSGGGGLTPLQYLESTGNPTIGVGQWIDTGIDTYKLETEIKFRETAAAFATNYLQLACGCWNANNNRYYPVQHGDSRYGNANNLCYSDKYNNITTLDTINQNVDRTVVYNDDNNKVKLDGVIKGSVSDITTTGLPFKVILFGAGISTFPSGVVPSPWRIYYAKFRRKDTDTMLGWFVPVLDTYGVPCMHDLVTDTLFYNEGTGDFTYSL